MVRARNLLRRHYDTYVGGGGGGGGGCFDIDSTHVAKQSMMAEHQRSMTGSDPVQEQTTDREQEEAESERGDDSWLQLGIGVGASSAASAAAAAAAAPSRPSVELELFSDRPSPSSTSSLPTVGSCRPTGPMFSSVPQLGYRPPPPPWGFNMMQFNMAGGSSSSSTTSSTLRPTIMMMPPQPPQFYNMHRFPLAAAVAAEEMRVVSPPVAARRQHPGVWFILRAAENQVREPFLPQMPKSYIRIKDGRMTVRLLMKYLAKKLGLDDESEVQIWCRAQPLRPYLTLQHVRDSIWCLSEAVEFLQDSPSIDHVMTLQYGRSP